MPVSGLCLLLLTLPLTPPPELEVALGDVAWLPPHEVAKERRVEAGRWRDCLQQLAAYDHARADELAEALAWARHCYRAWDCLEDATNPCEGSGIWALDRLEKLRDEIGPAAYLAGRLPWIGEGFARIE